MGVSLRLTNLYVAALLISFCAPNLYAVEGEAPKADKGAKNQKLPAAAMIQVNEEKFSFQGGETIGVILMDDVKPIHMNQLVTADGSVATFYGGTVNLKGKNLEEARRLFRENVRKRTGLRNPRVTITLQRLADRRIYVDGFIRSPRSIPLPAGYDFTLEMAISSVNGFRDEADTARIRVTRSQAEGKTKRFYVDFNDASDKKESKTFVLQAGDVVYVPRSEQFQLFGLVAQPNLYSRHRLTADPEAPVRVSQLVFGTGRIQTEANLKNVRIYRRNPNGTTRIINVDLIGIMKHGNVVSDLELKNGDSVYVPSRVGITVLGEVNSAGVYHPSQGETLTVSRAIAKAGGFTEDAKVGSVHLVRADTPNGKPIKINLNKITQDARTDLDLELQPGDMIYVGERLF